MLKYLRLNFRLILATDYWISAGLSARAWLGARRVGVPGGRLIFVTGWDRRTVFSNYDIQLFSQGDSGGPVIFDGDRVWLEGIISYGEDCAGKYPGVSIRVGKYLKWIQQSTPGKFLLSRRKLWKVHKLPKNISKVQGPFSHKPVSCQFYLKLLRFV